MPYGVKRKLLTHGCPRVPRGAYVVVLGTKMRVSTSFQVNEESPREARVPRYHEGSS